MEIKGKFTSIWDGGSVNTPPQSSTLKQVKSQPNQLTYQITSEPLWKNGLKKVKLEMNMKYAQSAMSAFSKQ
jgi:hypothetical protein